MSLPQNLILTVSGRHAAQFGSAAQKTFVQHGGSIGRADECDWVLPASGVSRTHAQVRYLNGMYFIEDCSTNGMLLNGSALTRGEPAMLGDGDRLQVDSFEIEARLQTIGAQAPVPAADEAFNPDLTQVAPSPMRAPATPTAALGEDPFEHLWRGLQPEPVRTAPSHAPTPDDALPGAAAELDPLRLLQPAAAPPPRPRSDADAWHHSAASVDHFRPPATVRPAQQLPENWDLTQGDFAPPPAPHAAPKAMPAPQPNTPTGTPMRTAMPDADERERIFAIVVEGLMEALRARAEIKNTFRLPVTVIQRSENNPLKFAATAQEAMRKLESGEGGAFLAGAAAFEDAFDDIRCHQMAMLAGMRAAYESLLFHFSPDRLEQEADRGGRRLGLPGKGRYWERYREQFQELVRDPDDCFRRLFGDEFARAYETQLARYKSACRATREGTAPR